MKILVIGGTRYFGKLLVQKLAENQKDQITVVSRQPLLDINHNSCGITYAKVDRRDIDEFKTVTCYQNWDLIFDQICMNSTDAAQACRLFSGRVGRYIATSSMSVYAFGSNLAEHEFEAQIHKFNEIANEYDEYAEAKRQMEATLSQNASFPVAFARFPIVLGPNDYTKRLLFHIQRIRNNEPIYFPNLQARMSFIHSSDAARGLLWLALSDVTGPINLSSRTPISLYNLVRSIEKAVDKNAHLTSESSKDNHSPFGIKSDWYLSVKRAKNEGFTSVDTFRWLLPLIESEKYK
ncbi:unnamed protein product [Didymodactylos carnosus]|uniref:NAD-dependent epimerase/dehydratase domain-containing protein n=1 Tax=Didymodactylos carnosus TaxID=1234261 RepID=A0A814G7G4_9BILA|nr:unnamed protein product [Didymodactylos carnosus]CAF0990212.1 unnamed protein product [Didymodactylos carnosus]CAF3710267.1 unnamed protein product [Didymodactylos carnosus]CAF3762239.1 unnamed protein product [Didymodactylos carnosus]